MNASWITGLFLILSGLTSVATGATADQQADPHFYTLSYKINKDFNEKWEDVNSEEFKNFSAEQISWCRDGAFKAGTESNSGVTRDEILCVVKQVRAIQSTKANEKTEVEIEIEFPSQVPASNLPSSPVLLKNLKTEAEANPAMGINTDGFVVSEQPVTEKPNGNGNGTNDGGASGNTDGNTGGDSNGNTDGNTGGNSNGNANGNTAGNANGNGVTGSTFYVLGLVDGDSDDLENPSKKEEMTKNTKQWCEDKCKGLANFLSCDVLDLSGFNSTKVKATFVVKYTADHNQDDVKELLNSDNIHVEKISISAFATSSAAGVFSRPTALFLMAVSWLMTRWHCC